MIPLVGFLPADDPRMRGTVEAIETRPDATDGFVQRYDTRVEPSTACRRARGRSSPARSGSPTTSRCMGRRDEARRVFDRLLAIRNDVGLLAEEYDPETRRQLGNFPQAFSHVCLVNTARNLRQGERGPAEHRGSD